MLSSLLKRSRSDRCRCNRRCSTQRHMLDLGRLDDSFRSSCGLGRAALALEGALQNGILTLFGTPTLSTLVRRHGQRRETPSVCACCSRSFRYAIRDLSSVLLSRGGGACLAGLGLESEIVAVAGRDGPRASSGCPMDLWWVARRSLRECSSTSRRGRAKAVPERFDREALQLGLDVWRFALSRAVLACRRVGLSDFIFADGLFRVLRRGRFFVPSASLLGLLCQAVLLKASVAALYRPHPNNRTYT